MDEADVFPVESAYVAMQAIADGVARITMTRDEALEIARKDIKQSRDMFHHLMDNGFIKNPPDGMLDEAMQYAIGQVKK
jgi:malate dehydrogenase (oxaloacetate-decarboxylating)